MMETIIKSFDTWTAAQTIKSNGRNISVANQRLLGIDKLRELILELAIRGKLVEQDEKDEPAENLMNTISNNKLHLAKECKIKKLSATSKVQENEMHFELPTGWIWTRISEIGHDWGQKTPENDFSYIEVSGIDNSKGVLNEVEVLKANEAPSRARKIVKKGTVIYSTVRPYLKNICLINKDFTPEPIASTAFAIIHPFDGILPEFVISYLRSLTFIKYVESIQIGIAYPAINDRQFFNAVFPLPPLAEQRRIVAKVDELMALCDQLEQQQTQSNAAHQQLVELLFQNLTEADTSTAFETAWQRIALNFDTLFTTEYSIDHLKQTILQLAVMGKLVPQDPNDEPASELLKKIAKEKERMVKEGKIKKQEKLPEITEEEKPFELPRGWEWVRWDSIALKIGDIDHRMPEEVLDGYPYVSPRDFLPNNKIDFKGAKKISKDDFMVLSNKTQPQRGDIIYPRYGTIGENRLVETDIDFLASYSCCIIKTLHGFISPKYQFNFSISSLAKTQAKFAENKTTQANVGIKSIQNFLFPFPPLSEQHRIVAKVDELFALCDALKARIKEAQETQGVLAEGVVEGVLG